MIYLVLAAVLGVAVLLAIARLARGPSMPDRAVALEVVIGIILGGIALHAAYSGANASLPLLLVVSLLGFISAVSVARFGTRREGH